MSEAIGGNAKTFKMVPILGTAAGLPLRKLEHVKVGLHCMDCRIPSGNDD
jgi:hypothetical protein